MNSKNKRKLSIAESAELFNLTAIAAQMLATIESLDSTQELPAIEVPAETLYSLSTGFILMFQSLLEEELLSKGNQYFFNNVH